MEASIHLYFYLIALSIICASVSGMPTLGQNVPDDPWQRPPREPSPSRSWSGTLRGPRRTSVPSRFDTQLVDLNRNPTYYNYHTLPEQALTDVGSPVSNSRPRQRRSPQDFGSGRRFGGVGAGFPSDDVFRPPRFRDEQPRQPERTPFSDHTRTECIGGGPSCTPKPQRKHFDFYT